MHKTALIKQFYCLIFPFFVFQKASLHEATGTGLVSVPVRHLSSRLAALDLSSILLYGVGERKSAYHVTNKSKQITIFY